MAKLTMVLCDNAANHMIKPGVVYRMKNIMCSEKTKLSAHVLATKSESIADCSLVYKIVLNNTLPQKWKHLRKEGLQFKCFLIIGNADSHSESVCYDNKKF